MTHSQSGAVTVETAISSFLLILILLGLLEVCFYLLASYDLQQATREGARVASILPTPVWDDERVADAVRAYLQFDYLYTIREESGNLIDVYNALPELPDEDNPILNQLGKKCNEAIWVKSIANFSFLGFSSVVGLTKIELKADASMRYEHQPICN